MNNSIFLSRLTGKLLGDGCFTKQVGRKPRFQFIHRIEDFEWSEYCYKQLRGFLPLNPPIYKHTVDSRLQNGFSESYMVQSKTSTIVTELESLWYRNRKKSLPLAFISQHLNEEALAWWYQDDGHLTKQGTLPKKIVLSTDSFSIIELTSLQKLLHTKFYLSFKVDGQQRLLLYDQPQIYYFLKLVEPYIQPCMNRKSLDSIETSEPLHYLKRTTIYLPKQILLQKPTKEINERLIYTYQILQQFKDRKTFLQFYYSNLPLRLTKQISKGYQICLTEENKINLHKIKELSGWNQSQIALLCLEKV